MIHLTSLTTCRANAASHGTAAHRTQADWPFCGGIQTIFKTCKEMIHLSTLTRCTATLQVVARQHTGFRQTPPSHDGMDTFFKTCKEVIHVTSLTRCSNVEEPGDTPRKGPLLAQKLAGKGGATAGAAASVPSTPGGNSSVQLAGQTAGANPEVSAPGEFSGKICSRKRFTGVRK